MYVVPVTADVKDGEKPACRRGDFPRAAEIGLDFIKSGHFRESPLDLRMELGTLLVRLLHVSRLSYCLPCSRSDRFLPANLRIGENSDDAA